MYKIRPLAVVLLLALSLLTQALSAIAQSCVMMDAPALERAAQEHAHHSMSHRQSSKPTVQSQHDAATMDCCGVLGHCSFGACVLSPPVAIRDFTMADEASLPAERYLQAMPLSPIDSFDRPPISH